METFMLTIYALGFFTGALIVMIGVLIRIKRREDLHEQFKKSDMACYRADVAIAAMEEREHHEREVRELKGRLNQVLGINMNICKAIESARRKEQ